MICAALTYCTLLFEIETGLDPYRYLTWLLKTAHRADLNDPEVIQSLLPWNAAEECSVN